MPPSRASAAATDPNRVVNKIGRIGEVDHNWLN